MPGYDYHEPGVYFITIVTGLRRNIFWNDHVFANDVPYLLSEPGIILQDTISKVFTLDNDIEVLNFIIMPDHVHLLIKIETTKISISDVVRWMKSRSSLLIRKEQPNLQVWQRSYYDHIVRNQGELELCNSYIEENPINWKLGKEENDPF